MTPIELRREDMKSVLGFGLSVLFLLMAAVGCQTKQEGTLSINDAWSRPGMAGNNSAIYLIIDNATSQDDSLLSAECDAAETVELHLSSMDASGNMSMHPQEKISIPAGQKIEFKPGGLHIMLIDLKEELRPGQKINAALVFENAGKINLEVIVKE